MKRRKAKEEQMWQDTEGYSSPKSISKSGKRLFEKTESTFMGRFAEGNPTDS
jgi:hypothetical protein